MATLLTSDVKGNERSKTRAFGTFTDDLETLRDWLLKHKCPVVAMESTGIYWRYIHNVLEGHVDVILVNARHINYLVCQWPLAHHSALDPASS